VSFCISLPLAEVIDGGSHRGCEVMSVQKGLEEEMKKIRRENNEIKGTALKSKGLENLCENDKKCDIFIFKFGKTFIAGNYFPAVRQVFYRLFFFILDIYYDSRHSDSLHVACSE
jgi:hypothetical protein